MDHQTKTRRDRLQNLLIVLLSVSAVLLFAQNQMANLNRTWSDGHWGSLLDPAPTPVNEVNTLADLAAPVRVSVAAANGRCGLLYATTADTSLSQLSTLLGSALGSAGTWTECNDQTFRAALDHGAYFDFLNELPLPILAGLLGTEPAGNTSFSARQAVLCPDQDGVRLYLRSEDGTCRVCSTAVQTEVLSAEMALYQADGTFFAFEGGESYAQLDPYTLLPHETPESAVLTVGNSLSDSSTLLRQLDFNPYTKYRYTEKGGTEVIVEEPRTLRLQTDGTVVYQAGDGDTTLSVSSAGETATAVEAVLGTRSLAETVLAGHLGETALYLESITATDTGWLVRFGFQYNGVPILFSDGSCGAEFQLTGSAITHFALHFRQYAASSESSSPLPLSLAVAIADSQPGAELVTGYVDEGGTSVSLSWLNN